MCRWTRVARFEVIAYSLNRPAVSPIYSRANVRENASSTRCVIRGVCLFRQSVSARRRPVRQIVPGKSTSVPFSGTGIRTTVVGPSRSTNRRRRTEVVRREPRDLRASACNRTMGTAPPPVPASPRRDMATVFITSSTGLLRVPFSNRLSNIFYSFSSRTLRRGDK